MLNLLLIIKGEKKHHVLLKDFNKFMYNQTNHRERKHFCMHCLQCFKSDTVLINHKENCITINGEQAIKMTKAGDSILKCNNFHKLLTVPFVIYAAFEAITKKYMDVNQIVINHTLKLIGLTKIAIMDTKWSVVMMMNTQNQRRCIGGENGCL